MQHSISISNPCHEDWDLMLPRDNGRHCLSCEKIVVDFSNWQIEDIVVYLQHPNEKVVCGRYKDKQLTPAFLEPHVILQNVRNAQLPFIKKIAALVVLSFCMYFTTEAQDAKRNTPPNDTAHLTQTIPQEQIDTTAEFPELIIFFGDKPREYMGAVSIIDGSLIQTRVVNEEKTKSTEKH